MLRSFQFLHYLMRSLLQHTAPSQRHVVASSPKVQRRLRSSRQGATAVANSTPTKLSRHMEAKSSLLQRELVDFVVQQRQQLVQHCPFQLLHIRGVTFEGRQELLQKLVPGQAVLLVKEPSNEYDPAAVAITALDGNCLGHVSRQRTGDFPLQACFGHIVTLGQSQATGNWGASVSCCSVLHGLHLDSLPRSWSDKTQVQQVFGAEAWQRKQQEALDRFYHRCAVSGITSSDVPLQVVPVWGFDHIKQHVWLADLVPIAEPLVQLKQAVEGGWSSNSSEVQQAGLDLLSRLMNWRQEDCKVYLMYVEQQRRLLDQGGWHFVPQRPPIAEE
eukprot:GHRR01009792.1.p1 GENE.GHRR01009792.1~~GHRR01009792.1.p1  ORF type:complete len:330 (+),score=106.31 GHRR01009792.1:262-1251(+)